ncbi:hypothetical protein SAY87_001328 [Trapa incisa]|uniref:Homeobox domain-containing protein n=1 Tax=Trapa incisa TaxID=236973 RepID=A0AAN7GPD5_9MYRT|nr:hypothetical protein SAY87_001328 [Trapa incisa]
MELALSLGDGSTSFRDHAPVSKASGKDLDLRVALDIADEDRGKSVFTGRAGEGARSRVVFPFQLDLLPFSPVPRSNPLPQLRLQCLSENQRSAEPAAILDTNPFPAVAEEADDGVSQSHSSPNSVMSSFHMELGISGGSGGGRSGGKRDLEVADAERDGSRGSDDDENGLARKKLRLSKEQSAFLEESFKEHSTLNPKQKLDLAKQLNLRPRQVEVWFQNRRARTKLKQTEIDCEYLKRYCETLTEENRRLQKELQELRALKTSQPFYMQLPATTLTMCPSCERVAAGPASNAKPRVSLPIHLQSQAQAHKAAS